MRLTHAHETASALNGVGSRREAVRRLGNLAYQM
jgi:hypothetical protein